MVAYYESLVVKMLGKASRKTTHIKQVVVANAVILTLTYFTTTFFFCFPAPRGSPKLVPMQRYGRALKNHFYAKAHASIVAVRASLRRGRGLVDSNIDLNSVVWLELIFVFPPDFAEITIICYLCLSIHPYVGGFDPKEFAPGEIIKTFAKSYEKEDFQNETQVEPSQRSTRTRVYRQTACATHEPEAPSFRQGDDPVGNDGGRGQC